MIKVDPKTGRMETVADPVAIDLPRARRECLDVIQGNVPFHVDTLGPGRPVVTPTPVEPACGCIPGLGYICDECLF